MTDTTAKIRAKGLDGTGVTEDIADQMFAHKGRHYMAIVEVQVDERHEKAGGKRRVDLIVEQFEPAEHNGDLDKHLRELTRTVYANRAQVDGQAAIDDSLTPAIADAVKAGGHLEAHPFLPTDAADDTSSCEVCGLGGMAAQHRAYAARLTQEQAEDDDTAYDDHEQPIDEPSGEPSDEPSDEEEPALT